MACDGRRVIFYQTTPSTRPRDHQPPSARVTPVSASRLHYGFVYKKERRARQNPAPSAFCRASFSPAAAPGSSKGDRRGTTRGTTRGNEFGTLLKHWIIFGAREELRRTLRSDYRLARRKKRAFSRLVKTPRKIMLSTWRGSVWPTSSIVCSSVRAKRPWSGGNEIKDEAANRSVNIALRQYHSANQTSPSSFPSRISVPAAEMHPLCVNINSFGRRIFISNC